MDANYLNNSFVRQLDTKIGDQSNDIFKYQLDRNYSNVFKRFVKIDGTMINDGFGSVYKGLGANYRFVIPNDMGHLAQLYIKTIVTSNLNLVNASTNSGNWMFDELELKNENQHTIASNNAFYINYRAQSFGQYQNTNFVNSLIAFRSLGGNRYEVLTIPFFHCFESTQTMINTDYSRNMTLDLKVSKSLENMAISGADISTTFAIEKIEVNAIFYTRFGIREKAPLIRDLVMLSSDVYQEPRVKLPKLKSGVDVIEGSIKIPINCRYPANELVMSCFNAGRKVLRIKRFKIYQNNTPLIDVDSFVNFVVSSGTVKEPGNSFMSYRFGFDDSRLYKSGVLPLDSYTDTFYLEVFYELQEPTDDTEYEFLATWSYHCPLLLRTNGSFEKFSKLL